MSIINSSSGSSGLLIKDNTSHGINLNSSGTGAIQLTLNSTGNLLIPNLKTTDPSVSNAIFASNGILTLSGHVAQPGPLTGDVTTSGAAATLVGTTNVESIIRANTLDQMGAAAATVNMNNEGFSNLIFLNSTVTSDPNPAVVSTYYRCNYASSGNFTLPSSSLTTGAWVHVKNIANNTITLHGTIDGQSNSYTLTQYQSVLVIWNGTNWDAN
jgi:hypothetical protein